MCLANNSCANSLVTTKLFKSVFEFVINGMRKGENLEKIKFPMPPSEWSESENRYFCLNFKMKRL